MSGISHARHVAGRMLRAPVACTLLLATALGCGRQPPVAAPASAATRTSQPSEVGPTGPADGRTEQHYFHNDSGPPGSPPIPPERLTAAQFDRKHRIIHWPPLLRDQRFAELRYQLDQLFNDSEKAGAADIRDKCQAMQEQLAGMLHKVPADEYAAASRFIKALEYEGRMPAD